MPFADLLGHHTTLRVRRLGSPGAFLVVDDGGPARRSADLRPHTPADQDPQAPTLLLPGAEVPDGTREGDVLEVFVYRDSKDRPVATTRAPRLTLGEVTFLTVTDVGRFGAFFDWGLPKELLVPHAEQTRDLRAGERHPVGLYLDDTGRLAGTLKVSEMLAPGGGFPVDAWVAGEAWRKEPGLGVFVIVERRFVGRLPESEPSSLSRGEAESFRVASVLPDGKIELSLRGHAHEEVERDAQRILAALGRAAPPRVGDRSSPEQIRAVFGLSKKAFKRAAGRLLKERAVAIDAQGFLVRSVGG